MSMLKTDVFVSVHVKKHISLLLLQHDKNWKSCFTLSSAVCVSARAEGHTLHTSCNEEKGYDSEHVCSKAGNAKLL